MIFLIADTHFYHDNIHKYCKRHSPNIDEYTNGFIYYINKFLKKDDIILHLGDLACGPRKSVEGLKDLMAKFKCEKHFIRGNHDYWLTNEDLYKIGFKSVRNYIRIDDVLFCHYPLDKPMDAGYRSQSEIWDLFYDNPEIKVIYHGHIHNNRLLRNDGLIRHNCSIDKFLKGYNICTLQASLENRLIQALRGI